jgi:Na+/H+ antiporter NhaD/arsenite permease-like protein
MSGDPPNIIIGTSLGYTFFDFLENTGVIVFICLAVTLVYFSIVLQNSLKTGEPAGGTGLSCPDPSEAITNKTAFLSSVIIFGIAVILLITHSLTTISVAAIGVIAAMLTLASTLVISKREGLAHIIRHVDYKTLLFFIGLFVVVGGLEETKVLR